MNFRLKVISNQVRKLVFVPIICAFALVSCSSPEYIKESQSVGSMGIIDMHGKWIFPPRYERIVYVRKIDAFWVKETKFPPPPPPPDWLNALRQCYAKNKDWKLLDRNGKQLKADLPYLREPAFEYPPLLHPFGVDICPDGLRVQGPDGLRLCDCYGHTLTGCVYNELIDVGDGLWMARETYQQPFLLALRGLIIPSWLGGDGREWPPFVFLDRQGRKVATLPQSVIGPRSKFVRGLLACDMALSQRVECAVDRSGKIVIPADGRVPAECEFPNQEHRTKFSGRIYEVPASSAKPIKFELDSPAGVYPKYFVPQEATDDIAVVHIRPGKEKLLAGLVDCSGKWLVKPIYISLTYCSEDRIIAAKGD